MSLRTEGRRLLREPDSALLAAGILAAGACILALAVFPTQSDDLLLYLTMGRRIVERQLLPASDPFVYAQLSAPMELIHEWGTFLVSWLVFTLGGWTALIAGKAGLILFAFLLPFAVARAYGYTSFLIPLYGVFSFYAVSYRFIERGSLTTDVFTAALTAALLVSQTRPRGARLRYGIPVIFLLWVNLHGGFFIGLAILALWCVAEGARCLAHRELPGSARGFFDALGIFLASLLACLVNPRGIAGLLFPLTGAVFNPAFAFFKRYNNEFKSLFDPLFVSFIWPYLLLLAVCIALALAVCGLRLRRGKLPPLFEMLVLGLLTYLALNATRFMLTVAFTSCVVFAALLGRSGFANLATAKGLSKQLLRVAAVLTAAGCVILTVRVAHAGYPSLLGARRIGFGIDTAYFPVRAVEFIDEANITGNLFNQDRFGAYLIWKWQGKRPIYYHGFVGSAEHFKEYFTISQSPAGFDALVRKYDIRTFLLATVAPTSPDLPYVLWRLYNDPAWRLVYVDPAAEVFVKDTPETQEVIRRYGLRVQN